MHHDREQLKCLLYTTTWICVCVGVLAYNMYIIYAYLRESSWRVYCIYSNYYEYACVNCTAPLETLLSSYISPNLTSVCDFWRLLCRYTQNKKVVNVCVVLALRACAMCVLSKTWVNSGWTWLDSEKVTVCVYCLCMCAVVCVVCAHTCASHIHTPPDYVSPSCDSQDEEHYPTH